MNPSAAPLRILFAIPSTALVARLRGHLESCGAALAGAHAPSAEELRSSLEEHRWDVVLCGDSDTGFDSLAILRHLRLACPDTPLIVVSASVDEAAGAELMDAGASDFVSAGNLARLRPAIDREVRAARNRRRKAAIEREMREANQHLEEALTMLTRTQEQVVRTERFKALGQMASGVAHDFNNELTKMIGVIELMMASTPDPSEPLTQLKQTVLDAANIVRRLRAFYKPLPPGEEIGSVDLNDVVTASIEMTKPRWKTQSAADGKPIRTEVQLGSLPRVVGRAEELQEALGNLIFNACDAMPGGGLLRIVTRATEGAVIISVEDSGCGMTAEVLRRCREPYYTTKQKTHSGIGLGLVDGLARRYGGKIEIESQPGKGTIVRLWVPVFQSQVHQNQEHAVEAAPVDLIVPPKRILLADDDFAVSTLLSQFLRLDGHEVDLAKDGQRALEKFDPERHQVVISDRAMPVLDGDMLTAEIKARAPRTPVIMASGFVDSIGETGTPPGVDYLLRKPITRAALRRALGTVFAATAA